MKREDAARGISSCMLNDKDLFGSSDKCVLIGCREELDEVFEESGLLVKGEDIFIF